MNFMDKVVAASRFTMITSVTTAIAATTAHNKKYL